MVRQHVCRLSLSKLMGFRSFLEQLKFYTLTLLDILNLSGVDTVLVTLAH